MARGNFILDESWVLDSLCQGQWADPASHRFSRYKKLPLPWQHQPLLKNKSICVLHSSSPDIHDLIKLLESAGARVTRSPDQTERIHYLVAGDADDLSEWISTKRRKRQTKDTNEVVAVKELIEKGVQLVTNKVSIRDVHS